MAPDTQFVAQAPHSMQASMSAIRAFFPSTTNTSWGQTAAHTPQPTHADTS